MSKARHFVAPRNSIVQQSLLRQISSINLPKNSLSRLLQIINADGELLGFAQVAHNLRFIIAVLADCWPAHLLTWLDPAWADLLQWIDEHKDALHDSLGAKFIQPSRNGRPPMWGFGAKRHPQYTLFSLTHEDATQQKRFALLQGHLLHACTRNQDYQSPILYEDYDGRAEWPGMPSSLYGAALAIQALSRTVFENFLERLPVHLPPLDLAEGLGLVPFSNRQEQEWATTLTCFFRKALGLRPWPSLRGQKRGRRNQPEPDSAGFLETDCFNELVENRLEPLSFASDIEQIGNAAATTKRHKRLLAVGEHFAEDDTDEIWVLVPEELENDSADLSPLPDGPDTVPVRAPHFRTGAQRQRIEMLHQLLPDTYAALSAAEITRFRTALQRWLGPLPPQHHPLSEEQRNRLQITLLLEVMISTGSALERAHRLKVVGPLSALHDEELVFTLVSSTEPSTSVNHWQVRALEPPYQSVQAVVADLECRRTSHIRLPEIMGVSVWLQRWLQEQNVWALLTNHSPSIQPPIVRCFPHSQHWYARELLQVLGTLDPSGRITEKNLSRWLFFRVVHQSQGDVVGAALLCGSAHELSHVRLFYDTRSIDHLQQLYRRAVSPLVNPCADKRIAGISGFPLTERLYVGSRLTPTMPAVMALLQRLTTTLKSGWVAEKRLDWVKYHNLYTLYTVGYFALATGIRAIRTPYLPLEKVDRLTGLATFADKDDEEGSKTRLFWIPPPVIQQMEYYREHVRALGFPTTLPCFLLDEQHRIHEVRPRTVQPLWAALNFPFPANFHRHFLRSQLIEYGCPSESVDAFLGHWYFGEEPWGEFSTFDFDNHIDNLRQYLLPVLNELSLHALRSRIR